MLNPAHMDYWKQHSQYWTSSILQHCEDTTDKGVHRIWKASHYFHLKIFSAVFHSTQPLTPTKVTNTSWHHFTQHKHSEFCPAVKEARARTRPCSLLSAAIWWEDRVRLLLKLHSNRARNNTQLRMEEDVSGKKKRLGLCLLLRLHCFLNHEGGYMLEQDTPARCIISILRDAQNPVLLSFVFILFIFGLLDFLTTCIICSMKTLKSIFLSHYFQFPWRFFKTSSIFA